MLAPSSWGSSRRLAWRHAHWHRSPCLSAWCRSRSSCTRRPSHRPPSRSTFSTGEVAARGKQYIVQLRAVPGGIVMQQLLYAPEVRQISDVGVETAPVKDSELALAKQLIAQISSKTFDPTHYEDEVKKRIEAAVQKKVEGEEIAISPSAPEAGAQVIDLMEALRASLDKTAGRRAQPKTAPEETAPAQLKAAQRKPPKRIAAEPEVRRRAGKR